MITATQSNFPNDGFINRINEVETSIATIKDELNNRSAEEWRKKESLSMLTDLNQKKEGIAKDLLEATGHVYNLHLGQAKADLEQIRHVIKTTTDEELRIASMMSAEEADSIRTHYEALEHEAEQEVERFSK
jgi:hypothetical protein